MGRDSQPPWSLDCLALPFGLSVVAIGFVVAACATTFGQERSVTEQRGQVFIGDVAVPGATVTASRDGQRVDTVTDVSGRYRLGSLVEGVWTVKIRMPGFVPVEQRVEVARGAPVVTWRLELLESDEVAAGLAWRQDMEAASFSAAAGAGWFPGATSRESSSGDADDEVVELLTRKDVLLVAGSVNNASASPVTQPLAFGNNRPQERSAWNGSFRVLGGGSALDARPFSFAGQETSRPSYSDVQLAGTLGGRIRLPGLRRVPGYLFLGLEQTTNHDASTRSAIVPTLQERVGDFSRTRDAGGRPVLVADPATGQLFDGSVIPENRISPQAAALLAYYPLPNVSAGGRFNYQTPIVTASRRRNVRTRLDQSFNFQSRLTSAFAYQGAATDSTTLFGFQDTIDARDVTASVGWFYSVPHRVWLRIDYRFARVASTVTPHFANVTNVSGEAGVAGNNQEAVNWGPPALLFSRGLAGLTDVPYARLRDATHTWSADVGLSSRSSHEVKFGAGVSVHGADILSQQNARGEFLFTGAASGVDLADFLLGIPQASSIAFGNADKYLLGRSFHAYVTDDWRLRARLTATVGVRWEYETPMTERFDRLVNLDVAPGFTGADAVVASEAVGLLTGRRYPRSLVRADRLGFQPRLGLAWRPVAGSSLVVRAGYGLYRNTSVYQSMATLLAQQPPLSTTLSVERSAAQPLTLANGFVAVPGVLSNTFAVDPDFRVGFAQVWQVSVGYDLAPSLTMLASYDGAAGHRLMRQSLPNTYPTGAVNPCPSCPVGFLYVSSDGSSIRHAGRLELRRRLRNGLTAMLAYTLSKAMDDGVTFTGPRLDGTSVAQDWLNPADEWGVSSFDRRHAVTAELQYTTGVGLGGAALWGGLRSALLSGWTFRARLTAGSGLPLTPVHLAAVSGTGVSGTLRPDLAGGAAAREAPPGYYLNPNAYTVPAPGHWGTAARHSVTGPAQFQLDAGIGRAFLWGDRVTVDWSLDAINILNRVTFASVNMILGSPQFGLPNVANPMRKVQMSLRIGF